MRKRKAYLLWEDPKVWNTEIKKSQAKRDAEMPLTVGFVSHKPQWNPQGDKAE